MSRRRRQRRRIAEGCKLYCCRDFDFHDRKLKTGDEFKWEEWDVPKWHASMLYRVRYLVRDDEAGYQLLPKKDMPAVAEPVKKKVVKKKGRKKDA